MEKHWKLKKHHQWKSGKVYEEVPNQAQNCISLRWVIKEKLVDNEKFTKARLCARDFEEEWNFRTDSPTCSREGLDLPCSIITWKKWTLNSLDIKTPFSQVKAIERTVYVRPPKKANTSEVWKLQKCIYDLADTTRFWYLKFKEERIRLGALISTLGKGIFI